MVHRKDTCYQDKHGVWWARVDGQRKTPNTRHAVEELLREMRRERERAWTIAGDPRRPPIQGLEVVVLRGVPGCGKTTWAKELMAKRRQYKRISRDVLRSMLDNGEYSPASEKFIRLIRDRLIRECLEDGHSVIVDDTNLNERDIREITRASELYLDLVDYKGWAGVPVRIVDFDTPLEECIRRDALRDRPVGAERIREMAERHGWGGDQAGQPSEMATVIERLMERPSWALDEG